jgi:hypothetical protein
MKIQVRRTDPEAYPLFLVYPLLGRYGKHGFLVTIWRLRFEVRW